MEFLKIIVTGFGLLAAFFFSTIAFVITFGVVPFSSDNKALPLLAFLIGLFGYYTCYCLLKNIKKFIKQRKDKLAQK